MLQYTSSLRGLLLSLHRTRKHKLETTMKTCTSCKKLQSKDNFNTASRNHDKLDTKCRVCRKITKDKYNHSIDGLVSAIYAHERTHSKTRGHRPPNYTQIQLKEWLLSQDNFSKIFDEWVLSGYNKWLRPSVDRVKDLNTYTLNNIQLMTFRENNKKAHTDRLNGVNASGQRCKAVVQYDKDDNLIAHFHSSYEAQRQTEIAQQNIGKCCLNKRPFAGGFKWEYFKDT